MIRKIREIVADITSVPVDRVTAASSVEDIAGWDSLAQISILLTVESEFGARFTPEEMGRLTSVAKILAAIERRPEGEHPCPRSPS
jgi:acyl carrier protein